MTALQEKFKPEMQRKDAGRISEGSTFGITEVKTTETPDPDAETNLTLRIGIKKQPNATIDHTKVIIQVFFYDTVDDKDIKLTDAKVNYEWLTQKHDWTDTNPEIFSVNYLRPKRKAVPLRVQGGERRYLGYRVLVYYEDKLQAAQAEPARLLQLFPSSPSLRENERAQEIGRAQPPPQKPSLTTRELSPPLVFVENFVKALATNDLDAQLRYYADRVDYYEFGQVTKEVIRKDLKQDITTWPNRIYSMPGPPKITPNGGGFIAEFRMTYTVTNPKGTSSGILQMAVRLKLQAQTWQVVGIQKKVIHATRKISGYGKEVRKALPPDSHTTSHLYVANPDLPRDAVELSPEESAPLTDFYSYPPPQRPANVPNSYVLVRVIQGGEFIGWVYLDAEAVNFLHDEQLIKM